MSIEYRDVPDFPGYRIGEDGTVFSRVRPKYFYPMVNGWYELEAAITAGGRRQVTLCRNKVHYTCFVYHLVLQAFVGDCPDGMVACHEDGDSVNDNLYNLRWDTQKNNLADRELHGTKLFGVRHPTAKINDEIVRGIRIKKFFGYSNKEIAKEFNIGLGVISGVLSGRNWSHVV